MLARLSVPFLVTAWFVNGGVIVSAAPNILWISAEDISPHLGCYGDPHAITPNLDQLATEGVRYTHAFATAGVCAPCRSGIITGVYQTSLGTHNMRSLVRRPSQIRPFPAYLREAGYYTSNNSKEDYQFATPPETWDDSSLTAHWRGASQGQPFFSVFNFTGCHESGIANDQKYRKVTKNLTPDQRQNASQLTTLPPYYPDTPATREDWKRNYELITALDAWVGKLIADLKADGLYEETIIMFWSDHGVGLPRAKRWLYDSGVEIPLVVRVPEKYRTGTQGEPGAVVDDLISTIDFGPTVLNLAGLQVPDHCQGRAFLGRDVSEPRQFVFAARDRMDERYDIIRMVRNKRFKYLRNYEPWKPYYQYMSTPEKGATMIELRRLFRTGELPSAASAYFADSKPPEELYDTAADPHEVVNLVDNLEFSEVLETMRQEHREWVIRTRDLGLIAEPILAAQEEAIGSRYDVLSQGEGEEFLTRLTAAVELASQGESASQGLRDAMKDREPAIRYWGAIGIGNVGSKASASIAQLTELLEDPSVAVRIAAARTLCLMEISDPALPILADALRQGDQWERLQAANVLDEIGQLASPLSREMHMGLNPHTELFSGGKYTVRVLTRALDQLNETRQQVP